jgi:hypothetical protein
MAGIETGIEQAPLTGERSSLRTLEKVTDPGRSIPRLDPAVRKAILIAAAIFLLNVFCNAPLFLPGEGPYRDSIEGGYASMARFIAEHPNPFGWNPMQYFGLPTQMWYLPGVPYTAALCIKLLPFLKPEHVHRLVVVTMTCLVPATVYLFALYFMRSWRYALAVACVYTFVSPAYGYYPHIDLDRGIAQVPWRIQVLLKYGEGPHNAGLALLPLALIAAWRAGTRRRFSDVFLTALLFAAIALTNWIAAMALAWCTLMMLLTAAGSARETGFLARRLLGAALLAYLFACFWLTPDYIGTVAFNWPQDAFGFRLQTSRIWLLVVLFIVPLIIRGVFYKVPRATYPCYLVLCAFGFTFVSYCHYLYNLGPIPESRRYALEAEIFVLLLAFELLRRIMATPYPVRIVVASVAVIIGSMGVNQVWRYPVEAWIMLRPDRRERSIEYKVAQTLASFQPRGRVLVTGGTRFRLNSWFLLPQVGGTFESGLRNRTAPDLLYSLRTGIGVPPGKRIEYAVRQIRLSGIEYIAVHGQRSREHWKDYAAGQLPFSQLFEQVWREEDDTIYRVPFPGYSHLIRDSERVLYPPTNRGLEYLGPFIAALHDTARPRLQEHWNGPGSLSLAGTIPADMLVSVMISYDPGWYATQGGKQIPIEKDGAGYMILRAEPAAHSEINLRYGGSSQQKVFTAASGIGWLVALIALRRSLRRKRAHFFEP